MIFGRGWHRRAIASVVLLLSIWVFVRSTIWYPDDPRKVTRDLDFIVFWSAARCCATGGNPYNPEHYRECVLSAAPPRYKLLDWAYTPAFVYAPNILPFLAPLGLLDWHTAAWVWRIVNIFALLIALHLAILWLAPNASLAQKMLMISFGITLSPTVTVLFIGQSPLLALCGMAIAGYSAAKSRPWLGGFGLMLGLVKPHLMLVFLLYVLLRRRFKMLFIGATLSFATFLGGLLLIHDSPASVLSMFPAYRNCSANQPASDAVLSFYGILARVGNVPPTASLLIGAIAGVALVGGWAAMEWRKGPSADAISMPFVVMVTLAFANTHKFDAVLLILFMIVLISEVSTRPRLWHMPCLAVLWLLTMPVERLIDILLPPVGALVQAGLMKHNADSWIVALLFIVVAIRYATASTSRGRRAGACR